MAEAPERPIWFVSDVHLTPSRPQRTARFLAFLRDRVAEEGVDLIIAGDLFDWWWGGKPVPADVGEMIDALEALPGSVVWMEGNHDLFVGRGLTEDSPIATTAGALELRRSCGSVHVVHGDLVDREEVGYRAFRALLRGLPGRAAARIVGQRVTRAVGSFAASGSRSAKGGVDGYEGLSDRWLEAAKAYAGNSGADLCVLGHGHWLGWWPGLVCLGDWLRWSSYARLDGDAASLWRYSEDGDELLLDAPTGAVDFDAARAS